MIEPRFKQDPAETWWIERSSCIGEDPELFFPVGSGGSAMAQTAKAIEICAGCPVRAECLEWALETCQDAGVWGGLGEEERPSDPTTSSWASGDRRSRLTRRA
jgi:WhiB family redox-sensing transcriptional regulator